MTNNKEAHRRGGAVVFIALLFASPPLQASHAEGTNPCESHFKSCMAAETCSTTSVNTRDFVGGEHRCQIWAECETSDGSSQADYWYGALQRVQALLNCDGELKPDSCTEDTSGTAGPGG